VETGKGSKLPTAISLSYSIIIYQLIKVNRNKHSTGGAQKNLPFPNFHELYLKIKTRQLGLLFIKFGRKRSTRMLSVGIKYSV